MLEAILTYFLVVCLVIIAVSLTVACVTMAITLYLDTCALIKKGKQ